MSSPNAAEQRNSGHANASSSVETLGMRLGRATLASGGLAQSVALALNETNWCECGERGALTVADVERTIA